MSINRIWGLLSIIIILAGAVYCEYKVDIPLLNALFDVVVTVVVFFVAYNDTQKKNKSQQSQIQELQSQIQELQNQISQQEEDRTNSQQNTLWQYAIKK